MLCYAVWDSSHQVLLHRLAQLTSCSATPSSAAHLKLCYTQSSAAQLIKLCYAVWDSSHQALLTPSSAAHLMLCYTV